MIYNGDASVFRDHRIPLFIKINRPLNPVFKTLIDEELLLVMILACDGFQHPLIFKALYLFTYFSFLRLSNILPHTARLFDASRHLCIGDLTGCCGSCG